ncbi:MAG: hypothetical protein ACREFT_10145 [Acetobacteraceae bacterium]
MSAGPEADGANAGGAGAWLQPPIKASEAQATTLQIGRNVQMTSLLRWLPGNVTLRERACAARGSVRMVLVRDIADLLVRHWRQRGRSAGMCSATT